MFGPYIPKGHYVCNGVLTYMHNICSKPYIVLSQTCVITKHSLHFHTTWCDNIELVLLIYLGWELCGLYYCISHTYLVTSLFVPVLYSTF